MKELRKKIGLTRAQLAEETGINFRTLEAYEQGRKDINGAKLKTLLKLCQALDCKLEDLITDPETKELLKIMQVNRKMYPAIFTETEKGDYLVEVPDMEILTEGKDLSGAMFMARDAIGLKAINAEDHKEEIPQASKIEDIDIKKGTFAEYGKNMVTLVDVDFREYRKKCKTHSYYAILNKEPGESEISVAFPDLNCATSGKDRDEALKSAEELLRCTLKGLTEDGEMLPKASELSEIVKNEKEEVVLIETTIIE